MYFPAVAATLWDKFEMGDVPDTGSVACGPKFITLTRGMDLDMVWSSKRARGKPLSNKNVYSITTADNHLSILRMYNSSTDIWGTPPSYELEPHLPVQCRTHLTYWFMVASDGFAVPQWKTAKSKANGFYLTVLNTRTAHWPMMLHGLGGKNCDMRVYYRCFHSFIKEMKQVLLVPTSVDHNNVCMFFAAVFRIGFSHWFFKYDFYFAMYVNI